MKFLVADTSSGVCGVGVFEDDKILSKNELDNGKTHSENFMPLVEKSLKDAKVNLNDIDCIGVVAGPGSFTGIRIGVASCKAMAEVKKIKMISVISLDSIAMNEDGSSDVICSLIDARNNQVYCGIFDKNINKLEEYIADDINVVIDVLKKYDNITFVGNGADIHKDFINTQLEGKSIYFSEKNKQCVESLGKVVYKKIQNGELILPDDLIPIYLRKSQAERMEKK